MSAIIGGMNPQFQADLDAALAAVTDAARAPAMRAYMRDQFDYLGIGTPQRRLAAKPLLKTLKGSGADNLLDYAYALWELPQREYQYVAIDLLAMHWKEMDISHIPRLLTLVQNKSWWDTVDALAAVISDVFRHTHNGMDAALTHDNMWVRRIALLHQLGWRDKVDVHRLLITRWRYRMKKNSSYKRQSAGHCGIMRAMIPMRSVYSP